MDGEGIMTTVRVGVTTGAVRRVFGIAFATIMFGASVLHAYWALGGMWGIAIVSDGTYGAGHPLSSAMRLVMWGFVLVLPVAGALVLMRVEVVLGVVPAGLVVAGCWVIVLVVLGVTIGAFTGDADVWRGPICLAAFVLALVVALPRGGAPRQGDATKGDPRETASVSDEGGAW